MACSHPISVLISPKLYGKTRYQLVPCGKCANCLVALQNSWAFRIAYHMKQYTKSCFVTLTYNNETVHRVTTETGIETFTLYKRDVQLWLKRMRKNYKIKGLSYFLCGEYGTHTKRPHYHIILFGYHWQDLIDSFVDWRNRFGFVDYKNISLATYKSMYNTSLYVAKYACKGVFSTHLIDDKVEPPFRTMSKGIGINYFYDYYDYHRLKLFNLKSNYYNAEQFYNSDVRDMLDVLQIDFNNRKFIMPRYLRTKIFGNQTILSTLISYKSREISYERMCSEQRVLQPEISLDEIFINSDLFQIRKTSFQHENNYQKLSKFYYNSKL